MLKLKLKLILILILILSLTLRLRLDAGHNPNLARTYSYTFPPTPQGLIINLGDLMKRWTNDNWLSTLHRVVNPDPANPASVHGAWEGFSVREGDSTRRQSVAFFHNLDKDAVVSNLMASVNGEANKYDPIIAGDFLMQKHLAATEHLEKK